MWFASSRLSSDLRRASLRARRALTPGRALLAAVALSCSIWPDASVAERRSGVAAVDPGAPAVLPVAGPGQATAVFAGGCFWCMESDFDKLPGVIATTSGYAGGSLANPTYEDVSGHGTGHLEAVHVVYDTTKLSYAEVLDWYWHHIDPTDAGGQFCDRGEPYRTAVFVADEAQRAAAQASKAAIEEGHLLSAPIATVILPTGTFWPAENYHQDFHETNPMRYQPYRMGCGRDATVARVWGKKG